MLLRASQSTKWHQLLLLLAAIISCSIVAAQNSTTAPSEYDSIWHVATSHADLAPVAATISQHPDLLLMLSDPALEITMFLPRNMVLFETNSTSNASGAAAVESLLLTSDLVFPTTAQGATTAYLRQFHWAALLGHALLRPRALQLDDLPSGQYPTANPINNTYTSAINITRVGNSTFVSNTNTAPAQVVIPNIRAGRSYVHIIDGPLIPKPPNRTVYTSIADAAPSDFAAVIRAAAPVYDPDTTTVPLTVLLPTNGAMQQWLRARNRTFEDLLDDTDQCARLVMGHVLPSPGSPALYVDNLLGLAAASFNNISHPDGSRVLTGISARPNLLGGALQLRASPYEGVSPGPLMAGFSTNDGRRMLGPWGRVMLAMDLAATEVIPNDQAGGGFVIVVHIVNRVLL